MYTWLIGKESNCKLGQKTVEYIDSNWSRLTWEPRTKNIFIAFMQQTLQLRSTRIATTRMAPNRGARTMKTDVHVCDETNQRYGWMFKDRSTADRHSLADIRAQPYSHSTSLSEDDTHVLPVREDLKSPNVALVTTAPSSPRISLCKNIHRTMNMSW